MIRVIRFAAVLAWYLNALNTATNNEIKGISDKENCENISKCFEHMCSLRGGASGMSNADFFTTLLAAVRPGDTAKALSNSANKRSDSKIYFLAVKNSVFVD